MLQSMWGGEKVDIYGVLICSRIWKELVNPSSLAWSTHVLPEEHRKTDDVKVNTDNGKGKELQETPGSQQCTVAPAEGDKTIDGDIPCEGHSFPEDHTQPQLREVSLGDNQPGAQDPTSSSLGE